MTKSKKQKVVLLGWDAADWNIINPLLDAGLMPALDKLINKGVVGNISTLYPPLSPMLWTSIATGKNADKHGVLAFTEPDVANGGIRPVTLASRKTRAIWNILNSAGKKCNVVGWWPSHPAEPINGVYISNFYHPSSKSLEDSWGLYEGTIHPESLTDTLSNYRIHKYELTEEHLLPFIPKLAEVPEENFHFADGLRKVLAETATTHSAATWLMENTDWDFMAVYFDGIDHISHGFMKFYPPQLPGIPDNMFDYFKDVVPGMYRFHDMMLERMVQLAGEDTTFIILSDHGFQSGPNRIIEMPHFNAAPAIDHRQYGILCMSGNNIKADDRVYGATLLDITPTILSLFDLPIGKDMEGKILLNAFETQPQTTYIESWDTVEGDFGEHDNLTETNIFSSAEAMQQLVELGYIADPGEDKNKAFQSCKDETNYNLSLVYTFKNKHDLALPILEELIHSNDKDVRFQLSLLECYITLGNLDKAKTTLQKIREIDDKFSPNIDLLEGVYHSKVGNVDLALECFKKAETNIASPLSILTEIGRIYIKAGKFSDAENVFLRVLEIDDNSSQAFLGLGIALLRQDKYLLAAEQLLNSIGLIYNFAPAHYHLGECLYKMGKISEATQAFEVCLKIFPGHKKALQWLVKIQQEQLHPEINLYENRLNELMKGDIVVVSGLPRSGTSLMMQLLQAAGIAIATDHKRLPDENNPKGYFEYEAVKSLAKDHSWLDQVKGKAIKIIAQLLVNLPSDFKYKVIFMERDISEIMLSQQKMLKRPGSVYPIEIANIYKQDVEKVKNWITQNPNIEVLYVDHHALISSPKTEIKRLLAFLKLEIDAENLIGLVDQKLYRNRK
ncbi:MAG: alkaline phosphatase family protein [Bacteroidota bacterium]